MNNPVLEKEDLLGLLEQMEALETTADNKIRVNSVTVKLESGVTGTFTRGGIKGWQVAINGAPDPVLGGYRDR